jgi:hypothetical protein
MTWVKTHVVARRNARGGRGAQEHLVAALRCLYRRAVEDGLIAEADNPARKVAKPRRLPSTRRAVPEARLAEINQIAATTGDDPELDTLLLRLHTETACRRGGALALRSADLDQDQCLILLREKGETVRWQPVSPTLMACLMQHGQERHAPDGGQLLRYADGRPITSRRYDHLWTRIGRQLTWVRTQQISMHWIRHTTLTWVEGRGVAPDASFGTSREHALPAAQRAALRRPRPAGAPCGDGDLGLHGPPGSDATMMRLLPLRGVHHRCACWHRDASGCSRLHRAHHRRSGERCPAGAAAARDAPGLRIIGHVTRLTWQPAALVAPHASRAWRQTSPQPPARPSATRHADAPPCRGRGRHASQPPAGGGS